MKTHPISRGLSVLTFMFCVMLSGECLATQPWGTALGSFNGVPNYSNGSGTYDSGTHNYSTGINTGLEWQCVEYAQRYYYIQYGMNLLSLNGGLNARDFFSHAANMQLTAYANGSTTAPQVGDLLCFSETGSGLGHVAIIRAIGSSTVTVIQQNVKNGDTGPNGADDNYTFAYNSSTKVVDVLTAGSSHLGTTFFCQGWLRKPASERLSAPTLSAPINGATGVSTSPSFSWSQVSENQGYRIIVSTSTSDLLTDPTQAGGTPSNGFNQTVAQNTTSYTWPGTLTAGTIYYWEVHALGTTLAQAGYWSSENYFTTTCTLPGFPGSPNPTDGATVTSQPTILDWSDASYATSYDVYLDGTFRANVSTSQWTLNQSLTLGTHNWYVIAKNSCGQSLGPPVIWSFTINGANISVTVQPSLSGRSFTVDGITYTTAQTFSWVSGNSHTIATTSPQSGGTGIQYLLSGWSDGGAISHTVTPTVGTTYTANFTTQYYLTMGYGTGGSGVSPGSEWCNSGASVGISATPASGYSFSSWTGTGSGSYSGSSASPSITMNGPITELANFTVNPVNISVTVQPSVSGCSFTVDGVNYTVAHTFTWVSGSGHTIATTSPQSGSLGTQYLWSSWSDNGAISHTVSPTVGTTYTANFTTQYFLTMSYGTGGSSVSPASGWYNSGQSMSLGATAASGYSFSSWTGIGDGSYSGSSVSPSITMNGPITETASFISVMSGVVFSDDMESGQGAWTMQAPWGLTTASSHSPNHSWTDSPGGNYQNNLNVSLTSPLIDLTGKPAATLTFWHRFDFAAGDVGNVWILPQGGSFTTPLRQFSGTDSAWHQESIDLSNYVGQVVTIYFQLFSDSSGVADGWYVDDAAITASAQNQLTGVNFSNGAFRFVLNGSVGSNYVIRASTNLINWVPIVTNTIPPSGVITIVDPSATNYNRRFYRATLP